MWCRTSVATAVVSPSPWSTTSAGCGPDGRSRGPRRARRWRGGPAGKAASAAKAAASRSDEGESEGIVGRVAAGPPPPCTGVRLIVRLPVASGAAREVVAEVPLRPQPIADGVAFDLPDFACLSVVTIDLPGRP
jgi:hypothetical protein